MLPKMHLNRYCCEDISLIENYNEALNDKTQIWDCHHRMELQNSDGELRLEPLTVEELKALDMYYNRPAKELIFLIRSEHMFMHGCIRPKFCIDMISAKLKGFKHTDESKEKIANAHKNKHYYTNGYMNVQDYECPEGFRKGMVYYHVEEHSKKLSNALMGHETSEERKVKISESLKRGYSEGKIKKNNWSKGRHWFNDGIKNVCAKECPEGFVPGRLGNFTCSEETRKKMSEKRKGRKFTAEH